MCVLDSGEAVASQASSIGGFCSKSSILACFPQGGLVTRLWIAWLSWGRAPVTATCAWLVRTSLPECVNAGLRPYGTFFGEVG